ncbi:MAG TPA: cytochrome P450 [Dehalococcoidia bacterium]|nr:cytochrome P450 [Dehalococcoidia bacterium]
MTTDMRSDLSDIQLLDPDVYVRGQPHDQWATLRAQAPVYRHEAFYGYPAQWMITRYADIVSISRQPTVFLSSLGIHAGARPDIPDPSANTMMITTDPPRHVRLRRLVNKGFTPRAIGELESHVRRIVTRILDGVQGKGACDFVTEVSSILPLAVICDMMGVPEPDWPKMFEWTNMTLGSEDPEYQPEGADSQETSLQARMSMFQYFADMAAQRHAERKDDLLGTLVEGDIDGEKLTDEEILYFCFLLIVAGNETTRNATTGGLLALFDHPNQRERLQKDLSLLPTAIEEILRWTSPVTHMSRVAAQDAEVGGQLIRSGEKLTMWYPSANRDEAVFPNPNTFDITRSPNEHIAFGIGEHFCLGASLARLELRVMFEELLQRLPEIQPAGPPERLRSNFIGGIKHLPVRWA